MRSDEISLFNVTKEYKLGIFKKKKAVSDLTLQVPMGETIGLLGPNGSGKSTTIKMILGFLRPTSGEITVCGFRPDQSQARAKIGYLPENPRFQKFLTGRQVLNYYGGLLSIPKTELSRKREQLLELVGIAHAGDDRVSGYSKGMTQRLAIAQALLNSPRLLIFDEPMSGLDPLGRREIRKLMRDIRSEMRGTTIFFSTHILDDVEQLCTHVALLRKGTLATFSPIAELLLKDKQHFQLLVREIPKTLETEWEQKHAGRHTPVGFAFDVATESELSHALEQVRQKGGHVLSVHSQHMTLEEALFADKPLSLEERLS